MAKFPVAPPLFGECLERGASSRRVFGTCVTASNYNARPSDTRKAPVTCETEAGPRSLKLSEIKAA